MGDFFGKIQDFFRGLIDNIKCLSNKQLLIYLGCAVAAVVLVLVLIVTACQPKDEPVGPVDESKSSTSSSSSSSKEPTGDKKPVEVKEQIKNIEEAFNQNGDVVGWLSIPGIKVDEPVLQKAGNPKYPYNNTDWLGKSIGDYTNYPASCLYTHYLNEFGKPEKLSFNTVIFGHSSRGYRNPTPYVGDEPTDAKFSQLFNFKSEEFARKTPYIFFSTADEDMVWEVFAVSYSDDGTWYIQQDDQSKATNEKMIAKMRANSLYDYDVKVTGDDKIITLSTCTAAAGPMQANWVYRFVIMAKLVDKDEAVKKEAALKINDDIKYPNGFEFHNYDEARAKHDLKPLINPVVPMDSKSGSESKSGSSSGSGSSSSSN